uniref:Uncharacterized protein n=1 Tax=Megaselia scalaris TaxID=36166 RepID=T1GL51_MEGSC
MRMQQKKHHNLINLAIKVETLSQKKSVFHKLLPKNHNNMLSKTIVSIFVLTLVAAATSIESSDLFTFEPSSTNSFTYTKRFDPMSGLDFVSICLSNCSRCKQIFGEFFLDRKCEESFSSIKDKLSQTVRTIILLLLLSEFEEIIQ